MKNTLYTTLLSTLLYLPLHAQDIVSDLAYTPTEVSNSPTLEFTDQNPQTVDRTILSLGVHGGPVVGDYDELFSANLGFDISYLYGLSDHFYLGVATGFTNYFGEDLTINGIDLETDDAQFVPVAGSVRFSPIPHILVGADIGYAIGLNDGNDGGFYASPRLTYTWRNFQVFGGYRLISFADENLGSIQFGFAYIIK